VLGSRMVAPGPGSPRRHGFASVLAVVMLAA